MAALGLLLAIAPLAWADSACELAFERWAKLSSARLRVVQAADARGACVPTEAVREELLAGLSRTRELCAEPSSSSDQKVQQARTLLTINQSFIVSLVVCPSDTADSTPGWATKSAPAPEKPKAAAPPEPPKPLAAAPPPPVAAPPPTPPCLEVGPAKDEHYALINKRCRGHTVLAVIETRGAAGETECKGFSISQSLAIRAPADAPPRVNHECVLGQGACTKDRLGNMFPECDW